MDEEFKIIMYGFLEDLFPITRIKNDKGRWSRVIVVNGGLVRHESKIYQWKRGIDVHLLAVDFIKTLVNVFGCTTLESTEIVKNYLSRYRI